MAENLQELLAAVNDYGPAGSPPRVTEDGRVELPSFTDEEGTRWPSVYVWPSAGGFTGQNYLGETQEFATAESAVEFMMEV